MFWDGGGGRDGGFFGERERCSLECSFSLCECFWRIFRGLFLSVVGVFSGGRVCVIHGVFSIVFRLVFVVVVARVVGRRVVFFFWEGGRRRRGEVLRFFFLCVFCGRAFRVC